jgi:hypothetical protein
MEKLSKPNGVLIRGELCAFPIAGNRRAELHRVRDFRQKLLRDKSV